MSFSADMARIERKWEQQRRQIHNGVCDTAFSSIVEGSPITGAPGRTKLPNMQDLRVHQ